MGARDGAPTRAHLERLARNFHASRIAQSLGIRMRYEEDAAAVFEMDYDPRFDHYLDDVHGGVIATLIDNAGWFAAAAHYETWIVTSEFHVRLLEAAGRGALRARGRLLRAGRRVATSEMRVHNASGVLVATGSGSFVVTDKAHPEL